MPPQYVHFIQYVTASGHDFVMTLGSRKSFAIILICVGTGMLLFILQLNLGRRSRAAPSKAALTPEATVAVEGTKEAAGSAAEPGIQALDDALKQLAAVNSEQDSRMMLTKLRAHLLSLPKAEADRLISEFLDGKRDASTKLSFTIQKNGLLADAPTLRIFLLDLLAQIDRQAAGRWAKQILSTPGAPDEWAICLRNYAMADPSEATRTFLEAKFAEMLSNSAWLNDPSIGFLEAFDTAVYTKDTGLTPTLSQLMANPANHAVAHAAYLTLDRLVISDPSTVLGQLEANPDMMKGHEQTRADYFARADLGDPQQKALVESYLLDPARSQQELQSFAGIYPNENYMVSNNLLTQTQTPSYSEIVARDKQALAAVQGWMSDPRFQALQPQLQIMLNRLQTFVNQADANGQ